LNNSKEVDLGGKGKRTLSLQVAFGVCQRSKKKRYKVDRQGKRKAEGGSENWRECPTDCVGKGGVGKRHCLVGVPKEKKKGDLWF